MIIAVMMQFVKVNCSIRLTLKQPRISIFKTFICLMEFISDFTEFDNPIKI